jgi:hypothetical protein
LPVAEGWTLCRCCDTHGPPGASQYMGETGVMSQACQSISVGCQAPKHPATHSSWRFETATLCCTESLEDGAGQYRSRQCEAASCTWSNGAAASETGGRRGRSVTGVQEGALCCSQGRPNHRLLGGFWSKRKVAMAAIEQRNGNITHASPATVPFHGTTAWVCSLQHRSPTAQHLHGLMLRFDVCSGVD